MERTERSGPAGADVGALEEALVKLAPHARAATETDEVMGVTPRAVV